MKVSHLVPKTLFSEGYEGESCDGNLVYCGPYEAAVRFTPERIGVYTGGMIVKAEIYIKGSATNGALTIYDAGSVDEPGKVLYHKAVCDLKADDWNEIAVDPPLKISGQDFWIGFYIENANIGFYKGPGGAEGTWSNITGYGWSNDPHRGNWQIRAIFAVEE
ncbi:MAG TPA: hypothetical protein VHY08_14155 [Bacillota bacterium]|nr:hypothetical protein [Bacillota bacterium]